MPAIPETWSALLAATRARKGELLDDLDFELEMAEEAAADDAWALSLAFGGTARLLAMLLATAGEGAVEGRFTLLERQLPALMSLGDAVPERHPSTTLDVLGYVNLAGCAGLPLPTGAEELAARWLPACCARPQQLHEDSRRKGALAAVLTGQLELVPRLVGGGALKPRTTPREIAGANVFGFIRHLAEVRPGRGGAAAVEGPWWSFLRDFPLNLASEGADWIDLFWAAGVMMARFEGRPLFEVGRTLPGLLAELS